MRITFTCWFVVICPAAAGGAGNPRGRGRAGGADRGLWAHPHVVLCHVESIHALLRASDQLKRAEILHQLFHEPDLDGADRTGDGARAGSGAGVFPAVPTFKERPMSVTQGVYRSRWGYHPCDWNRWIRIKRLRSCGS